MIDWIVAVLMASAPVAAPEAEPPAREQIMAVPPELQARLRDEVVANRPRGQARLQRLVEFMFEPEGLGMTYRDDATHTVEQAYATRAANCLSFTLLFVALARLAGLEASPQEIEDALAWHQRGTIVYRTNHVNAVVRLHGRRFTVDVAGDAVIVRHPPTLVSDERLLALYYNNQAAELLAQGRSKAAMNHMAIALELAPDASLWSNAGVLYLRSGDAAAAERAYARALALNPEHAGALLNMMILSQRSGDHGREAELRRRLEPLQRRDPFHQFLLAVDFEKQGDYRRAVEYYKRTIRLYPDEHRFYSGLASAYVQLGEIRHASRALARALALSKGAAHDLYQANLDSLRKSQETPRVAQ